MGADTGYDTKDFVAGCRAMAVNPHVTQHTTGPRSADRRSDHAPPRLAVSQKVRKQVEENCGWKKMVGGSCKLRYIGQRRNEMWTLLTVSGYTLVRMANLELLAG